MSDFTREYAKKLTAQMTIEEKMQQMLYKSPAIERLGIPAYNWWNEALHGVARAGVATVFPQAIGLSATFDPELIGEIGDAVSTEGRAKFNAYSKKGDRDIYKGLTFWAPNINIFRDPRWGRGHETYGEDPFLTAELGMAYVKGLQGNDPEHLKAAACAKHFAVHSGPEAIRHEFDAKASKRDMYDTYLYAFNRLVRKAKVESVMGAYNRVNGEPACGSKTLLKDILRDEWGYEGHVVSDCWAVLDFHMHHHVTETVEESAALAVNNGCDLNCGSAFEYLPKAYEQGLVSEEAITAAVERLMEVRIRLGMMKDYPSPYDDIPYSKVECKEHVDLSIEASRRSLVMLENKDGFLPVDAKKLKNVAVIGPNANSRIALVGNYQGTSSEYITPIEGIKSYLGDDCRVIYAEGCHLYKDKTENLATDRDRMAEAIVCAEEADVVFLCLGLDSTVEGEEGDTGNAYASGDKLGLELPGLQNELLDKVCATGTPVVLLLSAGSAMDVSEASKKCKAIIQTWYPGARGGKAIAEAVFGDFSPNGKLPVTFYANTKYLPEFTDYNMANRTYRYAKEGILYPFGYGLNYSKVVYSNANIDAEGFAPNGEVKVSVDVENAGKYPLHEAVQVYVSRDERTEAEPIRALKGLKTIALNPGEKKTVEITLTGREFATINEEGEAIVLPGTYTVSVGGHQPDEVSNKLTGTKCDEFKVTGNFEATKVEY